MTPPVERRSRTQAWLLVGVFFAPLLLAFILYYSGADWRPSGRTNRGELIQPPRPLRSVELPTADGPPLSPDAWRGKWTLVYIGDGRCDERCREALTLMRQTRLALNADMARVQRVLLATGNCCDRNYLDAEHPGLELASVDNDAGAQLLATFPDAQSAPLAGRIYIVDPLGNLMMRHAPAATPGTLSKGLLEDLRKLLKLSHIG
jgi:hypothetical protein